MIEPAGISMGALALFRCIHTYKHPGCLIFLLFFLISGLNHENVDRQSQIDRMSAQVKEVLPSVPVNVIKKDIGEIIFIKLQK